MKKETNEALTNDNMGIGEKLAFMIKRINCGFILSLSYCGAYSKTLHFSYCHQTNDGGTITTQGPLSSWSGNLYGSELPLGVIYKSDLSQLAGVNQPDKQDRGCAFPELPAMAELLHRWLFIYGLKSTILFTTHLYH